MIGSGGSAGFFAGAHDPTSALCEDGKREDGKREDGKREDGKREDGRTRMRDKCVVGTFLRPALPLQSPTFFPGNQRFMPTVKVRENEPFDVALRRFKRSCEKAGVLSEIRRREFYEKPTSVRKRKAAAAVKRHIKKLQREAKRMGERR